MWTGHQPDLSHVCIFGCKAHLHVPAQLCSKLQLRTREAIYVGPARDTSHHCLWIPLSKTVTESRDVTFLEDPTLELIFDVTPGAESLLQLPEPTPPKAPFIFRCIYDSDSSSSDDDDDEDIFLTPDLDNIDMNVLPLGDFIDLCNCAGGLCMLGLIENA